MKTISCRMEPKKFGNYKGRKGHDMRQKGRVPGYVDSAKVDHNSVIIATPSSVQALEMMNDAKDAAGARQKFNKDKNTLLYDGLLSFSYAARSIVHNLSREEQDRRALQSVQSVCDLHGGRLIGLTIHRDETTIHVHFQMLAVGKDGRLLRISREECSRRQDVAAQAWADLGITRGKEKALRIAEGESYAQTIHRSVRELHEDLPRELAELKEANKNFREENAKLIGELEALKREYAELLGRLGIAKEILQAEEGAPREFEEFQNKPQMKDGGPKQ